MELAGIKAYPLLVARFDPANYSETSFQFAILRQSYSFSGSCATYSLQKYETKRRGCLNHFLMCSNTVCWSKNGQLTTCLPPIAGSSVIDPSVSILLMSALVSSMRA